jgi:hypothetical protein
MSVMPSKAKANQGIGLQAMAPRRVDRGPKPPCKTLVPSVAVLNRDRLSLPPPLRSPISWNWRPWHRAG